MKQLLLLLLIPGTAFSQKYELNLGAGISTNTFNSAFNNSPRYAGGHQTINPSGLIGIYKNITAHLQVGIQITPTCLTYKEQLNVQVGFPPQDQIWEIKTIIANPAIPVLLTGNYKIKHLYVGLGFGYLFPVVIESKKTTTDGNTEYHYEYSHSGGGVVYNVHAGYLKKITKSISLDISASYNNCTFPSSNTFRGGAISYYNIIAGIRMGLF